jgi:predicted nucleic acid-binding protein
VTPEQATYGGRTLVVDKSAWERAGHPSVKPAWVAAMRSGQLALCSVTKLEILYSTRGASDLARLGHALDQLRHVPVDEGVFRSARDAMTALAERGSHRIPIVDYLVAACAQERSLDVLHYDRHFDPLAGVLAFESVWVAPAGSL